jgi:hypothetical protein
MKKGLSLKQALEKIRTSKKPPLVNKDLKARLVEMANAVFAKKCRREALNVLYNSNEKRIGEFLYYYHSDKYNVVCMVIDAAKHELVKAGKMNQLETDNFGKSNAALWKKKLK